MSICKVIYTKNMLHLGDCIYSMILFNNIRDYIEKNNIYIYFYCNDEHLSQVIDFNNSQHIIVKSISNSRNDEKIYDLWIGSNEYTFNWYSFINEKDTVLYYDDFFKRYYNTILNKLDIPITIDIFMYNDDDLLSRCNYLNTKTHNAFMNIDFLINNGAPNSGQLDYNVDEWNEFIIKLSLKFNIITTQKVHGIKCTRDYKLTVKDIAAISLNIDKFIAIESGVITGLYNKFLVNNPDKTVYTLSKFHYHECSFDNFIYKSHIKELDFLLHL